MTARALYVPMQWEAELLQGSREVSGDGIAVTEHRFGVRVDGSLWERIAEGQS